MPLHARVKGEELDGQYLSVNPLYAREGESIDIPKPSLPDSPMLPDRAYEIIHDELMLDGNGAIWRDPDALPEDLVFRVNYLGGICPRLR